MRCTVTAAILFIAIASASDVRAQSRARPERIWVGISGGMQLSDNGFDDAFETPLHAETERATVGYPVKAGAIVAASGGYRVWKGLTVGLGVTRYSRRSSAAINARLPHPFFDSQFREVEGTTSTLRAETAAHVLVGWMLPLTDRFRLIVTAGPSLVNVEQTLVTGVQFSEVYPYDTAEFTGATTKRAARSGAGVNAGADVMWMFSRRVGAGALVQFTRGRARVSPGGGRTISVQAGGAQGAAGLRVIF